MPRTLRTKHRARLAIDALESRTVPTAAGFNDPAGINADPTADSPYKIDDTVVGRGTGEPGWAGPWARGVGFDGSALVQSAITFEGDGALRVANNTNGLSRDWAPASTAGVVIGSQMVYFPPDGGVQQYLQGDGHADRRGRQVLVLERGRVGRPRHPDHRAEERRGLTPSR